MTGWLQITRGTAPLLITLPHAGTDLAGQDARFFSAWHARRDADWWIDRLYAFAAERGATLIRTAISRSVIDVNRDPSGGSLYPGQATTELCPTTDFDGVPLYATAPPDSAEIARRRTTWFDPYHRSVATEIARLRGLHDRIVLYDAHSIRSHIPRLFDGELPVFNIGTNDGATCDPALAERVVAACTASGLSHVLNGRFKGGWTTRRHADRVHGVHAIQMELAIRGYLDEPALPTPQNWPPPFDPTRARVAPTLPRILDACMNFAGAIA